jgi:hypothetical protein
MFLITICTSLVFLTNALASWMKHEYIYMTSWIYLVSASLAFHAYRENQVFYWLDQLGVFAVVICGLSITCCRLAYRSACHWTTTNVIASFGVLLSFSTSIYMYYIGLLHNTMCFSPDELEREYTHGLLHYVCCLGHHCVLIS